MGSGWEWNELSRKDQDQRGSEASRAGSEMGIEQGLSGDEEVTLSLTRSDGLSGGVTTESGTATLSDNGLDDCPPTEIKDLGFEIEGTGFCLKDGLVEVNRLRRLD